MFLTGALGLGRVLMGSDEELRDFLAKEQHGQRLGHVLHKKHTKSHHIWQKQGSGNSPTPLQTHELPPPCRKHRHWQKEQGR